MFATTRQYVDTTVGVRGRPNTVRKVHSGVRAGKHQRQREYADVLTNHKKEITTRETFQWNSADELSVDKNLYERWVKIFQVSERMCFMRAEDMQTASGKKANSVRLRNLFKDNEQFFLVAGVFQVYDQGKINAVVGASDWAVLTAQIVHNGTQHTSRIVLNEVCRAYVDKTKVSPTRNLLEETEKVLKDTYGVSVVYLYVEDERPADLVSGPTTINGKTLKSIYERYGYAWDGWEDAQEFRMVKQL